jgi:hypothetical protein
MSIKEIIDRTSIPEWFLGTAAGREILSETGKREAAERQKIVGRIAELRKKQVEALPVLAEAEAAARDRLAEARENLKAAEREVGEAWSKRFSESNALDLQIERLECQLRDGAPVEVADFIRRALNLIGLRQLPTLNQSMIDEIHETVAMARALMLEPSTAEMPKKLAALAARLPYLVND